MDAITTVGAQQEVFQYLIAVTFGCVDVVMESSAVTKPVLNRDGLGYGGRFPLDNSAS